MSLSTQKTERSVPCVEETRFLPIHSKSISENPYSITLHKMVDGTRYCCQDQAFMLAALDV
ncbi:hypothetical protein GC56T2_2691 [Geobacillus sp. C56-T2]|nr:hypothetical protein GC56T2_2691 [Geobacillus sp. C56-T2]